MTTVEVIESNKRIRLKQNDEESPYISKRELAKETGRSPTTLSDWEKLLIRYVADFRKYFKPRTAWNFYQAWCIQIISDYRSTLPRSAPSEAVSIFVRDNAHLFSKENYFNELAATINRESTVDHARVIEAA